MKKTREEINKKRRELYQMEKQDSINLQLVQKALEMYRVGQNREEIEEIFNELGINLKECLVPTDKKLFEFSSGNPWGEATTKLQTEASFQVIGNEMGFSKQNAQQTSKTALAEFSRKHKIMFGVKNFKEMIIEDEFKQMIPAHYYLEA